VISSIDRAALFRALASQMSEFLAAIQERIAVAERSLLILEQQIQDVPAGAAGPAGERGEKGDKGDKGDTGECGRIGPTGATGERGDKGDIGLTGAQGLIGAPGSAGERGTDGRDGRDGKDGRNGSDGRDALAIDIVDSIDLMRSYPRGTFARYANGILRARRDTQPVTEQGLIAAGWDVIVAGVASIHVRQLDDLRSFCIETMMTGGDVQRQQFTLPVMLYRETYQPKKEYGRGDVVTSDGSAWHCEVDRTMMHPGTSPDWKLIVKRGRNGADGKDGATGERGPEGARGRDLTQLHFNGHKQ